MPLSHFSYVRCFLLLLFMSGALVAPAQYSQAAAFVEKDLSASEVTQAAQVPNADSSLQKVYPLPQAAPKKVTSVELLATVGLYFTDFAQLNERLQVIGADPLKKRIPAVSGIIAIHRPVMSYGLEIGGYTFDNPGASFKGGFMRYFIGTHLFRKSIVMLHPQAGIVGSALNMFVAAPAGTTNLQDLFNVQRNSVQLLHNQTYMDIALGIKLNSPKIENLSWQVLRIGYRHGLKDAAWRMRGGTLADAPRDFNHQFYLVFCIGLDRGGE